MVFAYLLFRTSIFSVKKVHVDGEGNVLKHHKKISDSNASEDHIDGVPHVLVGEHQDVGQVEQGAHHAHQHCQPTVDWVVELLRKVCILQGFGCSPFILRRISAPPGKHVDVGG